MWLRKLCNFVLLTKVLFLLNNINTNQIPEAYELNFLNYIPTSYSCDIIFYIAAYPLNIIIVFIYTVKIIGIVLGM